MPSEFELQVIGHQIDFLEVSPESERSGDAIACRYVLSDGTQRVIVIDCGTKDAGERLAAFIVQRYGTRHVDHVVNTHPDQDHTSGLTVILEKLSVGRVWMHRPWTHSEDILHLFQDGRMTPSSLATRIREGLSAAHELEELAIKKGVPIEEPFQGKTIGRFMVMAPSRDRYVSLIPHFDQTPAAIALTRVQEKLEEILRKAAAEQVPEDWHTETLDDSGSTSDTNDSSVCLLGFLTDHHRVLFTGDAGVGALAEAAAFADGLGLPMTGNLTFVQVPHHGSRNNVSPAILDVLLGEKLLAPTSAGRRGTAFVSAGGASDTHPRRVVINAFLRRGYRVMLATKSAVSHSIKIQTHSGYSSLESVSLHPRVEAR